MSTTYQQSLNAYDYHGNGTHGQSFGIALPSKAGLNDVRDTYQLRQSGLQPHHHHQLPRKDHDYLSSTVDRDSTALRQSSRQPSAPATLVKYPHDEYSPKKGSESLIFHSLQIPRCISSKGGNLADFAAQMTCLFWFQPIDDLKRAETMLSQHDCTLTPSLHRLAKPHEQFRKWVYNVLSTTQVTQNVILLALLFIHRLKRSTPQIKGRSGSEYRLLTVALMLGNKFLDDNTYTNKTWAEVSCFAVQEIHVMEVEFLSNMRYNLLASKPEWEQWLDKLASFHEYYEQASRPPLSPTLSQTSAQRLFTSPGTSPTSASATIVPDFSPFTPTATKNYSPTSNHSQNWTAFNANTTSPLASKPAMKPGESRKRSYDEDTEDHLAKRHVPSRLDYHSQLTDLSGRGNVFADSARQAAPQLTIATNPGILAGPYAITPVGYPPCNNVLALPPLQTGVRAMATVHQPQAALSGQHPVPSTTSGLAMFSGPATAGPPLVSNAATPSKRRSPGTLAPFTSSPMTDPYGPASALHTPLSLTPIANSPSFYLQQRASPYRPIRHVNTLLYPPPSASLNQYHLSMTVPPSHMHYQPLGKRNDVRTGVVPEFVRYNRVQPTHMHQAGGQQGQYIP